MKKINRDHVVIKGEAAARMIKNFARIHDRYYLPGVAGTTEAENVGWPGDWEGRTVLALTLLGRTLKTEPAYLDEIVQWILDHMNEDGYRGELLDLSAINEQQLSGHGWLLRGLIEYYQWKKIDHVKQAIAVIIEKLFLPLKDKFTYYPRKKEQRVYEGKAAGELAGITVSGWQISSDTGCAFISLDGLTQAYELLRMPQLRELIEEMVRVFAEIDFAGITMQTHATLTATRGIMRMYTLTGDESYLAFSKRIFDLYKIEGMTENYANYNWFSRPSWTEPCGIIDSFMIAFYLWEETGEATYLEDAHHIWFNGIYRGQRPNGGFGCDHCVEDGFVEVYKSFYEAYWCCSMRGGEGTSSIAGFSMYGEADQLTIPFYCDGIFSPEWIPGLVLRERTQYPLEGNVCFEVCKGDGRRITLKLYLPPWAENVKVLVNGAEAGFVVEKGFAIFQASLKEGTVIVLNFNIPLFMSPTIGNQHRGSGLFTLRHGALVLGTLSESCKGPAELSKFTYQGNGMYICGDDVFAPLCGAYLLDEAILKANRYRILFHADGLQ